MEPMGRREFLNAAATAATCAAMGGLTGCAAASNDVARPGESNDAIQAKAISAADLPPAQPDPESQFGVDMNVNVDTIDSYLGMDDVSYRDMRLLQDPARYEVIGGNSELSMTLPGFRVVPYPYLGTLSELPVQGSYEGDRLFDVEWTGDDGLTVASVEPRYTQSAQILEELFPKDASIFLMCGGGGYAAMAKALLVYLGWDAKRLYVLGGMWDYAGENVVQLASYANPDAPEYYFWRTDVARIDFSLLHRIGY